MWELWRRASTRARSLGFWPNKCDRLYGRSLLIHEFVLAGRANPKWFIFFDPPGHTKLRSPIMRAFTPRVVANLEPRIPELSRELLDQRIEHGEMDLAVDFSVPLPMMVIAEMLGVPLEDRPRFTRWNDVMLS
jgi:cytochrome P450